MNTIAVATPLRISLTGGSTDLQDFIDYFGYGHVISFTPNLYTYIYLTRRYDGRIKIYYSHDEDVDNINDIKNDVAREVLKEFNIKAPISVIFSTDVPSTGSGLASSSSYVISLVVACSRFINTKLYHDDILKMSLEIEHRFNPLTGKQDIYGCGIPGLKYMRFSDSNNYIQKISRAYFDDKYMYLIPTNIYRKSTGNLFDISLDNRRILINDTYKLKRALSINDSDSIADTLNIAWQNKKIISNWSDNKKILIDLDTKLTADNRIISHKLCGAGAGGFFWVLSNKELDYIGEIPIHIIDKIPEAYIV